MKSLSLATRGYIPVGDTLAIATLGRITRQDSSDSGIIYGAPTAKFELIQPYTATLEPIAPYSATFQAIAPFSGDLELVEAIEGSLEVSKQVSANMELI